MKSYATVALMTGILAYGAAVAGPNIVGTNVIRTGKGYTASACGAAPAGYARCFARFISDSSGHPLTVAPRPHLAGPATTAPCQAAGCLSPAQLRAAYGITGSGSSSTTVAIVDAFAYPTAEADLARFRSDNGLPPCPTWNGCLRIVGETGGSPPPTVNAGWDSEQALDLDAVSTMCPNCRILLLESTNSSFRNLSTAVNTAAAMGAHVISNSYGGGEGGSQIYEFAYNHPGVAITASTGDNDFYAGPQFPATSPHVTAVGGTSLEMRGLTRVLETVWNWQIEFADNNLAIGTGSGCSAFYGQPYWQAHTNANMANNTLCTTRMEADVSADADPNMGGLMIFLDGAYAQFGGTSLSAPLIGGIYGERNDTVVYGRNPYLAPSSALHDITSGNNDNTSCGGLYLCSAKVGYDGPTGLGTPNGDSAF